MGETKDRYIVTVDDREFDILLSSEKEGFLIESDNIRYNVIVDRLSDRKFLFKINNSSSEIDITRNGRFLGVFLEGKEMNVRVEPYSLAVLRKQAGGPVEGPEDKMIRAPMPGLVLSARVQSGDKVSKGDTLVIIEAMKMENMIKAPYNGTVGEIFIRAGQAVDKNEKLVELA
jgi:biotin carboxyl carrier protein